MREPDCLLVRLGEIALKSPQVQRRMFGILLDNIRAALKGIDYQIETNPNRIFIHTKEIAKATKALKKVFGITSLSPAWRCHSSLNDIRMLATDVACAIKLNSKKSFAIRARRAGRHRFTSQSIAEEAGAAVKRVTKAKVDLTNPDKEIFIECRSRNTYIFIERLAGSGGMPLGTAGRVVCLLSGGIDSAVAAWLLAKRGCLLTLLYADNAPYTDETTFNRAKIVAKILKKWHIGQQIKFFVVNHGKNLEAFSKKATKFTCILCKRMMYRLANAVAQQEGALAIATGESLAQVASQTLANLRAIDEASALPVLRPLIGWDKQESIELAKKIGTYEKSILQAKSCGAVPDKPITKADLAFIKKIESQLNLDESLEQSLKSLKEIKI